MSRTRELRRSGLLSLLLLALAGCPGGGGGDVDAGAIDAGTDATGCDPDRPVAMAPEIVYSPGNAPESLETQLHTRVDAARESIDISIYGFTLTGLADKLIAAERRGVQVRVIFDRTMMQANTTVYNRLTAASGVEKKWSSTDFPFSHAKYLVIDRELAFLMSANLSLSGMDQQRNVGILDRDPENVADLAEIFDADWAGRPAQLDCTRLMVSPADARTRVLNLISSAERTLDIEVYYIADIGVRTAIIGARNRGVTVRVILSEPSEVDSNTSTATALEAAGVAVRILSSPVPHIKLVMVDGEAVLVGSHNLSNSSLVENREVGEIVRAPAAVTTLRTRFDGDWALGRDWP